MQKWIYEFFYRVPFIPISWIFGSPHKMKKYTELFESGQIPPGRAIDLGCGEGSNAIYLSKIGFDVTGVDFSPTALKRARTNANVAGVDVTFLEDDLTNLRHVNGQFDLLVDFGSLTDLNKDNRDLYMQNVLPLTHPGSDYILMCFVKGFPRNEVESRFGKYFDIETLSQRDENVTPRTIVTYRMIRY